MSPKICSYWEGCQNLSTHYCGTDPFCDDHDVRTPEEATIDRLRDDVERLKNQVGELQMACDPIGPLSVTAVDRGWDFQAETLDDWWIWSLEAAVNENEILTSENQRLIGEIEIKFAQRSLERCTYVTEHALNRYKQRMNFGATDEEARSDIIEMLCKAPRRRRPTGHSAIYGDDRFWVVAGIRRTLSGNWRAAALTVLLPEEEIPAEDLGALDDPIDFPPISAEAARELLALRKGAQREGDESRAARLIHLEEKLAAKKAEIRTRLDQIERLRSLLSRARDALYTAISRGDAFFSPGVGLKNRAVVAEIEKELGT